MNWKKKKDGYLGLKIVSVIVVNCALSYRVNMLREIGIACETEIKKKSQEQGIYRGPELVTWFKDVKGYGCSTATS